MSVDSNLIRLMKKYMPRQDVLRAMVLMRQYVDNRVESFLHARDVMESEGLIEEELEQFTAGTGPEEPGITLTDTVKPKKKPKRKSAKEVKVG